MEIQRFKKPHLNKFKILKIKDMTDAIPIDSININH